MAVLVGLVEEGSAEAVREGAFNCWEVPLPLVETFLGAHSRVGLVKCF